MLTQAELLAQLESCGHPKTPRGLTAWRAKGFLPRMVQRGVGRGRGASFVWTEPDILDRALLIDDLLDGGVRGDQVVLCSWFAGYDADLATVRAAWIGRLASATGRTLPKWFYDVEDLLGDLSRKLARALATQTGTSAADLDAFIFEALNVFYRSSYRFDLDDNEGLADKANEIATHIGKVEPGTLVVTDAMLQQGFAFIRDRLSVPSRERLLNSVTDDELSIAHRRWRLLLQYARGLFVSHAAETSSGQLDVLGRRLSIAIGPWVILALLHVARSPHAGSLCEAERTLGGAQLLPPEDVFAAMTDIWERSGEPIQAMAG